MKNSKTLYRKSRRLRKLSSLTEGLIAPAMQKRSQVLTKIIAGWPDIAGDAHRWCLPSDITFPANSRIDAILTLSVTASRGPQIQMMSKEICKRVNSFCGFAAVSRIKIRQDLQSHRSPTAKHQAASNAEEKGKPDKLALARLEKVTANIKNPELRAALIRLGQAID